MKKHLFIASMLVVSSVLPLSLNAQTRRARPATTASATGTVTPVASQSVIVQMKTDAPIVGKFAGATVDTIYIEVSGNKIKLNLSDIASIQVGDAPPVASPAAPVSATTLNIEAGLVYKATGAQAVSRTRFYLLDDDAEKIFRDAGLQPVGETGLLSDYYFANRYGLAKYGDFAAKADAALKAHLIQTFETDFSGKAKIENLSPRIVYIFGYAETRKGFALWNTKVDLSSGNNSIILDQKNAATAF